MEGSGQADLGPETREQNVIEVQRETIPIVFVPGIMGSRAHADRQIKLRVLVR